jgi:hypothetical protein
VRHNSRVEELNLEVGGCDFRSGQAVVSRGETEKVASDDPEIVAAVRHLGADHKLGNFGASSGDMLCSC